MPPKRTREPSPPKASTKSAMRARHPKREMTETVETAETTASRVPTAPAAAPPSPSSPSSPGIHKDGIWRRLRSLVFAKEDFDDDLETPVYYRPGSPTHFDADHAGLAPENIPQWQRRTVQILERSKMPQAMQRVLFDTVDFFTRRRVYLALSVVMFTCLAAIWVHIDDTVNFVRESFVTEEENRPGIGFLERFNNGKPLANKHPVIIVPGFITGALELWESNLTCMRAQGHLFGDFRIRMYGPQMIYSMLRDPYCWLQLFGMNHTTGLDINGVRVRADTGFSAIDYFVPGYWVWAKVLVNLADIGYDPQSVAVATYDWRLSPSQAHKRDGFFYKVRNDAKFLCQKNRRAAVFVSHSYGTTMALAFFKWTEEREPGWMNKYVAYYVNVGGTTMGTPKAFSAVLMGDVRDTLTIPRPVRRILDTWVSQAARFNVARSWGCFGAMLPTGCDEAFPNLMVLPNGTHVSLRGAYGALREEALLSGHTSLVQLIDEKLAHIDELPVMPTAPNTTVVCLYGVNERAEEGYYVMREENGPAPVSNMSYTDTEKSILQGVQLSNGDGTVSLNSLAYMCRAPNGWRQNVGRVVTIEIDQQQLDNPLSLRGGGRGANHVDILGNFGMLETLMRIAGGLVDEYNERVRDQNVRYDQDSGTSARGKETTDNAVGAEGNPLPSDPDTLETTLVGAESVTGGSPYKLDDLIVTNIDELIATQMYACTLKKNVPIQPKDWRKDDDNEFIETQ